MPAPDERPTGPKRGGTTEKPHFLRGVLACPRCGNDRLEVVSDGFETNLLCHNCWTCWLWSLGWMAPVPTASCAGCWHREECVRRHSREGEY